MILMYLLICVLGFVFGSFFNVLIYRLPKKESFVFPSSHCPNCAKEIKWHDNIPIFSYILLKGRCRECNEKISMQYPMIELLTGIVFLLIFMKEGLTLFFAVYVVYFSSLLIVSAIDMKTKEINLYHLVFPFIVLIAVLVIYDFGIIKNEFVGTPFCELPDGLLGGIIGGGFIFAVRFLGSRILKQEAMGEGDIYIAILMGMLLGYRIFFYSMILAGAFGLIAFVFVPYIKKSREIPFAPFMSMGVFASYLLEPIFRGLNLL